MLRIAWPDLQKNRLEIVIRLHFEEKVKLKLAKFSNFSKLNTKLETTCKYTTLKSVYSRLYLLGIDIWIDLVYIRCTDLFLFVCLYLLNSFHFPEAYLVSCMYVPVNIRFSYKLIANSYPKTFCVWLWTRLKYTVNHLSIFEAICMHHTN